MYVKCSDLFFPPLVCLQTNRPGPGSVLVISVPENHEEKLKRIKIENALDDPKTTLETWKQFAKSEYGLINGELAFRQGR